MRKVFLSVLLASFMIFSGALADPPGQKGKDAHDPPGLAKKDTPEPPGLAGDDDTGPPELTGTWEGNGRGIFINGTVADITSVIGVITSQDGDLFSAQFSFTVAFDGVVMTLCPVAANGHISTNKEIKGIVFSEAFDSYPGNLGFFDAKLTGKQISGVMRDFADMSTSYFSVEKVSDDIVLQCPVEP